MADHFTFKVKGHRPLVEVPADATLADLHEALHKEVLDGIEHDGGPHTPEEADDHMHAFWLNGKPFSRYTGYCSDLDIDDGWVGWDGETSDVKLARLLLRVDQKIAYVWDFGTSVKLMLTVRELPERDPADALLRRAYTALTGRDPDEETWTDEDQKRLEALEDERAQVAQGATPLRAPTWDDIAFLFRCIDEWTCNCEYETRPTSTIRDSLDLE